jgi:hypothetical protein
VVLKKTISFLIIALLGIQVCFLNSDNLIQKILELRQTYIIEKSDNLKCIIVTKKNYSSLKKNNEIIYNGAFYDIKKVVKSSELVKLIVIEDKNENLIKYICYSLKKEKSKKEKAKLKRSITLAFQMNQQDKKRFKETYTIDNNFYLKQNKNFNIIKPLLKPPII